MNKIGLIAVMVLTSLFSVAQSDKFIGIWEGDLDAGVQKLRMIFTFKKGKEGVMTVTIQAPQQSALQIPADTLIFVSDSEISLEKKQFKMSFSGKLINDSTISGNFVQGLSIPLVLKKVEKPGSFQTAKRPQTPRVPFPYPSINIRFPNKKEAIQLAGTLTLPDTTKKKKYPAMILISGSGAQDRDETIAGHKPFAVIADHLTKKGFAVLRYDDRGTAASTGDHSTATSADFADDTKAAIDFLKSYSFIDADQIGLIGHSEGGMIAQMVAASTKDVKRIILLADPGIPCIDLLTEQNVAIFKSIGLEATIAEKYGPLFKKLTATIFQSKDSVTAIANGVKVLEQWEADEKVKEAFKISTPAQRESFATAMVVQLYNPWFKFFLNYKPAVFLQKISCAVLALNGSKDIQVLPASNLAGIKQALEKSKSKNYEVIEMPHLNHLFQTCDKCGLDEYGSLEESFSISVLQIISGWLQKQVQ